MALLVPVLFEPAGVMGWVAPGSTVAAAAREAGILLAAPCGGRAVCGSCGVRVLAGALDPPDAAELAGLNRAPADIRLACRATVSTPVTVRPIAAVRVDEAKQPRLLAGVPLAAGVDLGTTSVGVLLVELGTGREMARASVANEQQAYGADVLSRVSAALAGDGAGLQRAAESSIRNAFESASVAAGCVLADVLHVVIGGNTAMAALLAGVDVEPLSHHPFAAPQPGRELPPERVSQLGLSPTCRVELVPPLAAFVGGDALAAALSAGLVEAERPQLLVDFGTNAEVVLAGAGGLVVASTAAGPAFEGVGGACGGPAVPGAVESVSVSEGEVVLETVAREPAQWFSGAGLVSALGALRASGHVLADGSMTGQGPLAARFSHDEAGVLGVDLGAGEIGDEACLRVSQLDVRAVQLAKAAIRVAVEDVLARAGVAAGDLESVAVAGSFGGALDVGDLVTLGILPATIADRARSVGNAALEGAAAMALDPSLFVLAEELCDAVVHVDLAAEAGFGEAFITATAFEQY